MPDAQFSYWKDLGSTVSLLTISLHLQNSLETGMESYIVQLDFSAAFDKVCQSGLLLKSKSFGVGGIVLLISSKFLFNCRQRAMVDGVASEWIPMFLACHRKV